MKAEKVTRDEKAKDETVIHQRAIAPSQDEENLPEKNEEKKLRTYIFSWKQGCSRTLEGPDI